MNSFIVETCGELFTCNIINMNNFTDECSQFNQTEITKWYTCVVVLKIIFWWYAIFLSKSTKKVKSLTSIGHVGVSCFKLENILRNSQWNLLQRDWLLFIPPFNCRKKFLELPQLCASHSQSRLFIVDIHWSLVEHLLKAVRIVKPIIGHEVQKKIC